MWIMDANFGNSPTLVTSWNHSNIGRRPGGGFVASMFDGHAEVVPSAQIYPWPSVWPAAANYRSTFWDIKHASPPGGPTNNMDLNGP
jgi:hypothetical protein